MYVKYLPARRYSLRVDCENVASLRMWQVSHALSAIATNVLVLH